MITTKNLSKTYNEGFSLGPVDLNIRTGEVYGLLGPNGSGKTTLISLLTTLVSPSSGQIEICGLDTRHSALQIRSRMNVINGGEIGLIPWLTPIEFLRYVASLYKINPKLAKVRIIELLSQLNLSKSAWGIPCSKLSKGMKQRVMIAKGLLNQPQVLFLDEPTIGLDIEAVSAIQILIRQLADNGCTIVLTSHNLSDLENTADTIGFIRAGRIEEELKFEDIQKVKLCTAIIATQNLTNKDISRFTDSSVVLSCTVTQNTIRLKYNQADSPAILQLAASLGSRLSNIAFEAPDLKSYYLEKVSE